MAKPTVACETDAFVVRSFNQSEGFEIKWYTKGVNWKKSEFYLEKI